MDRPSSSRVSQLFFQFTDTHFFRSSLFSGYPSILLAISSKATRRLRLSSTEIHWLSSSLIEEALYCGNGVFIDLPGNGGAFAIVPSYLNVLPIILPAFLQGYPLNASCLPQNGPLFLFDVEDLEKYRYLFFSHASGCTSSRPQLPLAPSRAPKSQSPPSY